MSLLYFLPILGGVAIGVQVVLNGALQNHVGALWTVFVSHIGGAILALGIIATRFLYSSAEIGFSGFKLAPWYTLLGGVGGFITVIFTLAVMKTFPLAVIMSLIIVGQLLSSALLDHVGVMGAQANPLTATKILGILVLTLGAYLIKK